MCVWLCISVCVCVVYLCIYLADDVAQLRSALCALQRNASSSDASSANCWRFAVAVAFNLYLTLTSHSGTLAHTHSQRTIKIA